MKNNSLFSNKFELIFDERIEGTLIQNVAVCLSSSEDEDDEDETWSNKNWLNEL